MEPVSSEEAGKDESFICGVVEGLELINHKLKKGG